VPTIIFCDSSHILIVQKFVTVTDYSSHCLDPLWGLCYWREKLRHLYQLLHTYCDFVWFALSSRATNSTSFSGAHHEGFKGFSSDLPSPSTTPISNSLQTNFIDIFQQHFPMDCNTPNNIFNTLFTHNPNRLHIMTTNTSSTTSSPLPMLTPSPTTPLLPTLIVLPPSPTTPTTILYTMATVPKTMPARGHATAPKFILLQPRELPCYFNKLNNLFQDANISDEGIKKVQACRYIDIDESELWQVLPEYTNNSYDKWKKAVLTLYPGAMEDCKWSMADLNQLLGSTSRMGIMNSDKYAKYYCKFFTITQFLIGKLQLSESEQSCLFQWGFQLLLWAKIEWWLEVKIPDHYPGDPYDFEKIKEAVTHVLRGTKMDSNW